MDLSFESWRAENYTHSTQRIRILSEWWVGTQAYCPNCGNATLQRYPNNRPVADLFCRLCKEDYEIKSQRRLAHKKIPDGAYGTMIQRLNSNTNPNLFLLVYEHLSLSVSNLLIIPKHFFTPDIIEQRKPLSSTARRAGWIGCNIGLAGIPFSGRIFLIKDKVIEPKEAVLAKWQQTLFLRDQTNLTAKGWLLSVMSCVEKIGRPAFSVDEVYSFEDELRARFPGNLHIKEKIRQQLQVLRDKNYLEFTGRGNYRLVTPID